MAAKRCVRDLVDSARPLEGIARHASTHAAGVVISSRPLTDHVPLQRTTRSNENDEARMTQYAMDNLAKIGLLKLDLLGLGESDDPGPCPVGYQGTTWNRRRPCEPATRRREDVPATNSGTDRRRIPAGRQRPCGVSIKELKPTRFTDIAAMVALYRPGPMQHIPTFIGGQTRSAANRISPPRSGGDPEGDLRDHRLSGSGPLHCSPVLPATRWDKQISSARRWARRSPRKMAEEREKFHQRRRRQRLRFRDGRQDL